MSKSKSKSKSKGKGKSKRPVVRGPQVEMRATAEAITTELARAGEKDGNVFVAFRAPRYLHEAFVAKHGGARAANDVLRAFIASEVEGG